MSAPEEDRDPRRTLFSVDVLASEAGLQLSSDLLPDGEVDHADVLAVCQACEIDQIEPELEEDAQSRTYLWTCPNCLTMLARHTEMRGELEKKVRSWERQAMEAMEAYARDLYRSAPAEVREQTSMDDLLYHTAKRFHRFPESTKDRD